MNQYMLDIPYPSIKGLDLNVTYGQMLLSNLGGTVSEMSAISLYIYNAVLLETQWPELSTAFLSISQTEMKHLQLFSRMCSMLGVDPRLWDCQNDFLEYWSPGYNVYPRQIKTMLENAIISENHAIQNYEYQLRCIQEPIIQSVLNRIILDEKHHVHILENFLNEYMSTKNINSYE